MKRTIDHISSLNSHTAAQSSVNWKLEAIRHLRVMMGQGYRRIVATQKVADALGRSIDDIQSWERELVKSSDAENELMCSEFAGELMEYLASGHYTNVPHYKIYGNYSGVYNVARAAEIIKLTKRHTLAEIRANFRNRTKVGVDL